DVQATAAAVLLRFGDADAERMMDAFIADPDGSGWDEEVVAAALGVEGSATAVPVLTRLVRSEIWDTRQLAARSLGETKLPAARETLEKVLAEDDDEDVKTTAAAALIYGFGDSSGVEFLTTAVKESKDYEVVVEAIRALSVAGGSKDLFQAAWDRKVTRVEHLLVKVWAAHALLKTP
ncbi:MAG: HEAT repeat domain-containing protein, partial [Planctomycetota bacterium]